MSRGNLIICGPKVYRFETVTFEVHSYFGPWPLNQDGSPKARTTRSFWTLWERFKALPPEERERYRVH